MRCSIQPGQAALDGAPLRALGHASARVRAPSDPRPGRAAPKHDTIAGQSEWGQTVVVDQLIETFIKLSPSLPGVEEARIAGYGVPVWALVAHSRAIGGASEEVARDYGLPREAVDAALAYYRRHKAAFEARIAANTA